MYIHYMNLNVLFTFFWFIFYLHLFLFLYFHIDIVYGCIVLRCIVKHKLTLTLLFCLPLYAAYSSPVLPFPRPTAPTHYRFVSRNFGGSVEATYSAWGDPNTQMCGLSKNGWTKHECTCIICISTYASIQKPAAELIQLQCSINITHI